MIEQLSRMLENNIARHKAYLQKIRAEGATQAQIEYTEKCIQAYEDALRRRREELNRYPDTRASEL